MATTLQKIYSDIDFTFTEMPVTGDIAVSYDSQAVIRSLRNIILTNKYEKPFNPTFGSQLNNLLFEPISPVMEIAIENEITAAVNNYEPRITLQSVKVEGRDDLDAYTVTITFFIQNSTVGNTVTFQLQRDR
jgi:phage baseplate assembly protein W